MVEYNPETHVAVPKEELAKLEESRVALYDYLTNKGVFELFGEAVLIHQITDQIWYVANRTKWSK